MELEYKSISYLSESDLSAADYSNHDSYDQALQSSVDFHFVYGVIIATKD